MGYKKKRDARQQASQRASRFAQAGLLGFVHFHHVRFSGIALFLTHDQEAMTLAGIHSLASIGRGFAIGLAFAAIHAFAMHFAGVSGKCSADASSHEQTSGGSGECYTG
jgi:hypothetical protein